MTRSATVRLSSGAVRGRRLDGHLSFRGTPHAAPPVGELRWCPSAPVEPWSGVRDATEPRSPAPQTARSFADVTSLDEDCLTLDVTVPAGRGTGRPVVVWLHGDVVVVMPNFRLGVFGCFGHPGLADGGTSGLQDQRVALRWVRRDIARSAATRRT